MTKQPVYIISKGALNKVDQTIRFFCDAEQRFFPVEQVSSLMVFGDGTITKSLLALLSNRQIPAHFFTARGNFLGSFMPMEQNSSGKCLIRQVACYLDPQQRMAMAKTFVHHSLKAMRQTLLYYRGRGKSVEKQLLAVDAMLTKLDIADSINQLMAYEGNAREAYYQAFDLIIGNADFMFEKRSRRPPANSLNCLISFGNAILYAECLSQLHQTKLDSRIAYLHASNERAFSLHLDVADVFKPAVVDAAIFTVLNKGMLTGADFSREKGGIYLRPTGREKFISAIESRFSSVSERHLPERGEKMSLRWAIRSYCFKIQQSIIAYSTAGGLD